MDVDDDDERCMLFVIVVQWMVTSLQFVDVAIMEHSVEFSLSQENSMTWRTDADADASTHMRYTNVLMFPLRASKVLEIIPLKIVHNNNAVALTAILGFRYNVPFIFPFDKIHMEILCWQRWWCGIGYIEHFSHLSSKLRSHSFVNFAVFFSFSVDTATRNFLSLWSK